MKINIDKNKPMYETEGWVENFKIRFSDLLFRSMEEGSPLPRFYLPVVKNTDSLSYECWILPLAPLVVVWRVLTDMIYNLWFDIFRWQRLVHQWKVQKANSNKYLSGNPVAYYRLPDDFYEFLKKCEEKHVVDGFDYDGSRNFGVVLKEKK